MRIAAALVATAMAGCFSPHPPQGAACATGSACPEPLACIAGVCVAADAAADAITACSCASAGVLQCPSGTTACPAGCDPVAQDRCMQVVPSNGIDPAIASGLMTTIIMSGATTIDTDTGQIIGTPSRQAGSGTNADIAYEQVDANGAHLGVFAMGGLTVAGAVTLTGSRAAVFIVVGAATLGGTIDGTARCAANPSDGTCPGPGGQVGSAFSAGIGGGDCNGFAGVSDLGSTDDTGGGGGGGGSGGGAGGNNTAGGLGGGDGGSACMAMTLEPLRGGGAGGAGGPGAAAPTTLGGAGGGALQVTSFRSIEVTGAVYMNGGGGGGGPGSGTNAGAGGGGGAGGGVLLEAPTVAIDGHVLANGGGGGGGGADATAGSAGQTAPTSGMAGSGGSAQGGQGKGGDGGTAASPARAGADTASNNSGAGGGAVGVIYIRSLATPTIAITPSPTAGTGMLRTQ